MPLPPNVKTMLLTAPATAPTSRTLADHLGDVLNVKSFGAIGDGVTTGVDGPAIQRCFDTAFGGPLDVAGASSPHGITNAHLNRAVFFPAGKYITSAPLTLTDVYGARIHGSGRWTSAIFNTNTSNPMCVLANGLSHCLISDLEIIAANVASANSIGFDLDWDGSPSVASGGVGLSNNLFENVEFGGETACIRIAHSNNEGHANQFIHCSAGTNQGNGIGFLIEGPDANVNFLAGGNINTNTDYGVKCTGGSFHAQTLSIQTTNFAAFYVSSGEPCSITGARTESHNFFVGVGTAGHVGRTFMSAITHLGVGANDGPWQNSHAYVPFVPGVTGSVISQPDNYNVYKCLVAHTSAAAGTFAADRAGAAAGKWAVQPVAVLADLTYYNLILDAATSGDYSGSLGGGILTGDANSTFYSRGGVFLRDTLPDGTDFYTGFAGIHTPGTYVI